MSEFSSFFSSNATIPASFKHQTHTTEFICENKRVYIGSDAGTGKTRSCLDAFVELRSKSEVSKALVLAPKAILEAAWVEDARKFTPGLRVVPCFAKNRRESFADDADIYVTNHDAADWLAKNKDAVAHCDMLIIDEATAFKNPQALRSRAVKALSPQFNVVVAMCGTPMPQGLIDMWHQMYLVDEGERLGSSFYSFRSATHDPVSRAGFTTWVEKQGAREVVADLIADRFLRYELEECIDMPERSYHAVEFSMPPKLTARYHAMLEDAVLLLEQGTVSAVNAAAMMAKLLQIASGAVYESPEQYHVLDQSRYNLVAQMVADRQADDKAVLLPFIWRHQKEELIRALTNAGVDRDCIAIIDSSTPDVNAVVARFQAGDFACLLAHPKSASHGLTLTRACTTIWSSPTMELDRFMQFNARSYRAGQKKRTEVYMVSAKHTVDQRAYERLQSKNEAQSSLLSLLLSCRQPLAA